MHRYPSPAEGAPGASRGISYFCVAVVDLLVGKFEMVRVGDPTAAVADRSPRSFLGARHLYWKSTSVRIVGSAPLPGHGTGSPRTVPR
jgi:hypothetical protein